MHKRYISHKEIKQETVICPYCLKDAPKTEILICCGEIGHGALAYDLKTGEIVFQHEVEIIHEPHA